MAFFVSRSLAQLETASLRRGEVSKATDHLGAARGAQRAASHPSDRFPYDPARRTMTIFEAETPPGIEEIVFASRLNFPAQPLLGPALHP